MKTVVQFLADETGAVTVDWIVLTSTTLLLVLLGATFLGTPISDLASDIAAWMNGFSAQLATP